MSAPRDAEPQDDMHEEATSLCCYLIATCRNVQLGAEPQHDWNEGAMDFIALEVPYVSS